MAYKQDGFLTGLLTNFRKRKDFKIDAKENLGAYNKESNTVNVKQGDNVVEMPMRKYTKKALENKPKAVVNTTSYDARMGNLTYNMEFSESDESSKPEKKDKSRNVKVKNRRVTTPDAKYNISKGKKGFQKIRKK